MDDDDRREYEGLKRRHAGNDNGNGKTGFRMDRLRAIELATAPRCIVEDLIPREGLTLVWGPPKCGKTFWSFDLFAHVALGRRYGERDVEPGAVVYIACEGEHGVRARALAFCQARMGDDDDPPFFLMTTRLDLVVDIAALIEAIRHQLGPEGCIAIVIDTLNRSIHGSESKDEDMGAYVQAADQLREAFRCAVVLIHHCGVAGDRPRGHTSLTGAIDAQIAVQKDADGTLLATVELMKDGPEGAMMRCRLDPVEIGTDDRGNAITSCVVEHLGEATRDAAPKRPKLSSVQRRALALLADAIATGGEIPPASTHIPANTRCVTEEVWRKYCYQGGISTGDTQEAKRKAFTKAADTLIGDNRVGSWDAWVWPVQTDLPLPP